MMNKKKTSPFLAVKYLLVIPLVLATLFTIRASDLDKMVSDYLPENIISEPLTRLNNTKQEAGESIQLPDGKTEDKVVDKVALSGPEKNLNAQDTSTKIPIKLFDEKASEGVVIIQLQKDASVPSYKFHGTPDKDKYLVVMDGKELSYEEFQKCDMDPNTVQSIIVYKDHSAIEKYGEKGKNGVVIIELKKEFQEPEKKKEGTIPDYRIRQGTSTTALQSEKTSLVSDDLQVDISHAPFNISDITHVKSENSGPIIVTTRRKEQTYNKEELNMNPLFIVDGIAVDSVDEVSPENIQTISVLKEKSAIALYGEKAKNGVVIITTKEK